MHGRKRDGLRCQITCHQGPIVADPFRLHQPSVSIAYLQLMLEILAERGISRQALLQGIDLDPGLLAQPQARMTPHQWTLIVARALALTGDPGLGYEYGLRLRPTAHGIIGYAAMTSGSLRQAQQIAQRYMCIRQAGFTMHLSESDGFAWQEVREVYPIPTLRRFFFENVLLGLARAKAVLLGRELSDMDGLEIWFDWPEPDYHAAWRTRLPPVRFSAPANLVRLPLACLDLPTVLADSLASRQAIDLCERELSFATEPGDDLVAQVQRLLQLQQDGYPSLTQLADQLHLSSRTLKRRLQQQGTSFSLMQEDLRRRDAKRLLGEGKLAVQQVASLLGYRDPANFSRAFQRWQGETPSQYRRRLSQGRN